MHALQHMDFHDSCLIEVKMRPDLNSIAFILFAPAMNSFYEVLCNAVLRVEWETTGIGEHAFPLAIYDVCLLEDNEYERWMHRVARLSGDEVVSRQGYGLKDVRHIVFASSLVQSFDLDREDLRGISVVCRSVSVNNVSRHYSDELRFKPGAIPTGDDE